MENTIIVSFPTIIPKDKVKFLLENNIQENSAYSCSVEYVYTVSFNNYFNVSSEHGANAFYLIGMTSSVILEAYHKRGI